jgi:hypothetical protein
VIDLYAPPLQDSALRDDEFVISADEKTSIQARRRKIQRNLAGPALPCALSMNTSVAAPGLNIAAVDIPKAEIFARCELNEWRRSV